MSLLAILFAAVGWEGRCYKVKRVPLESQHKKSYVWYQWLVLPSIHSFSVAHADLGLSFGCSLLTLVCTNLSGDVQTENSPPLRYLSHGRLTHWACSIAIIWQLSRICLKRMYCQLWIMMFQTHCWHGRNLATGRVHTPASSLSKPNAYIG